MKKFLIILFAGVLAVMGASCGESENDKPKETEVQINITSRDISKTEGEKIQEEIVKRATKPGADATEPRDATEPSTSPKKKKKKSALPTQGEVMPGTYVQVTTEPNGSFDSSDLDFIFEGAYIYLNDTIDDARGILGDDIGANEISKTKTEYEFDDVTIVAYEKDGTEKIEKITVTTDKIATKKGAKIGMYGTKLRPVYGVPTQKSETAYTYTKGNKSLVFNLQNNVVYSYSYVLNH